MKKHLIVKLYIILFWIGYSMVFLSALVPLTRDLHDITIGPPVFRLHIDQLLHTLVYFLITTYYYVGNAYNIKLQGSHPKTKFLLLIVALATFSEVVQIAVPSRSFNYFDIFWNIIGILAAMGICSLILKKRG